MSEFVPQDFSPFFEPIMGDAARLHAFRRTLALHVRNEAGSSSQPERRYSALFDATSAFSSPFVDGVVARLHNSGRLALANAELVRRVVQKDANIGLSLTMSGLLTVGDIYHAQARGVPQLAHNVRANTGRMLRYLFGMAFCDSDGGVVVRQALFSGVQPTNWATSWLARAMSARGGDPIGRHKFSHHAFRTTRQGNEQLVLQPRFPIGHSRQAGRGCPARLTRLHENEQGALLRYMYAIGDVALREIYPHHFTMYGMAQPLAG